MSFFRRSAAVSLIAVLALAGCTKPEPPPPPPSGVVPVPPPSSSPTPSREDIAGRRAGEFFVMTHRIASDPQVPVTEMAKVARGSALQAHSDSLTRVRNRGVRMIGPAPQIRNVEFGVPTPGDEGRARLQVALCLDLRGIDHIDASGKSVKESGPTEAFPADVWLEEWPDNWYVTDLRDGSHAC